MLKLASQGYSQTEIAQELQISQPQVSKDITAITKAAQQDINHHIHQVLPFERRKALMLYESIKRKAVDIANQSKDAIGERDRIAALALARDTQKEIIALHTQGTHIKRAIEVAGELQERLDDLPRYKEEESSSSSDQQDEEEEEEEEEEEVYDHE